MTANIADATDETKDGVSTMKQAKRALAAFMNDGLPAFHEGDRVVVMDERMRTILGDETGVIKGVQCPFGGWEYRVVADDPDPDGWMPNVLPDEGQLLTADQIERYQPMEAGR